MEEYNFEKEELEEIVILAAIHNRMILPKLMNLPKEIFKDEYYSWIFSKIKYFYKEYRKPIKRHILLDMVEDEIESKKQKLYVKIINEIYKTKDDDIEDVEYSIAALKTLVNRRNILNSLDLIIDRLKNNDITGAMKVFNSPPKLVIDLPEYREISFDDNAWEERANRRLSSKNRFANKLKLELYDSNNDFDTLAKYTYVKGRHCLWLAPPKGGKTTMGIHCAIRGALQGLKVLIVDRENGGDLIEDRIDANLFNLSINSIEDGSFLKSQNIKSITSKRKRLQKLNKLIRVIYTPKSTIWDLYSILDQFRYDDDWIPDVIIDDYPGLMKGKTNNNKTQFMEDRYKEFDLLVRGDVKSDRPPYLGISFIHTIADATDEEYTQADISWAKNVAKDVDGLNGLLRSEDERMEDIARIQFLLGRHWGKSQGRQICVNFIGETCTIRPMINDV